MAVFMLRISFFAPKMRNTSMPVSAARARSTETSTQSRRGQRGSAACPRYACARPTNRGARHAARFPRFRFFPPCLNRSPLPGLLVKFGLFFFQALFFLGFDDVDSVHLFDLGDVVEVFGNLLTFFELIHLDRVPRADFLIQTVFRFCADQLQ